MLSSRLEMLRTEKRLTKKQMAQQLKIAESTYGKYELGKRQPDLQTLSKLADFFDVSVDFLLGRTDMRKIDESTDKLHKQKEEWSQDELKEIQLFKEFMKMKREHKKKDPYA